jgi:hypothetical protein
MPWDIAVELENRPGTLAELGEAAANAGINLDGICGFPSEGIGVIHVLVDDPAAARDAFTEAGITVRDEREVLVADVTDRPGELGELTRRLADGGVNVDLIYLATDTRLVLGVDDLDGARGLV